MSVNYLLLFIITIINLIIFNKNKKCESLFHSKIKEFDFNYTNYQNNIITPEMRNKSGWEMDENQVLFLNGIIRKYLPKNCLEIGVSQGGSSILILNAIKDIKNSFLISIDLNENYYKNNSKKTGWRVKKYFSELSDKWSLYTGDQPHKFLIKLKMKYDFLFLDTAHVSPGELFNIIEVMPFLNENAIIVLHDIIWHRLIIDKKSELKAKVTPTNLNIMTFLFGDKIFLKGNENQLYNIGAIFLYKNQKSHYKEYFLSLMVIWDYMPNITQLNDMRIFIKKYYNDDFLLELFNEAVDFNKKFYRIHNKTY